MSTTAFLWILGATILYIVLVAYFITLTYHVKRKLRELDHVIEDIPMIGLLLEEQLEV